MVHNAEDSADTMGYQMLQSKMSIANNVITKRKEQLKQWEVSDMNQLAPLRRDPVKVKFHDSDVFLSACSSGDEEEIDELLEKGADINTTTIDGVTALHQAVIDGKIDTINLLLDRNANIDAQDNEGWTPLHAAVCCGSLPIVKLLCERGCDLTLVNFDKDLAIDLAEDDDIKNYLDNLMTERGIDQKECREREQNTMMKDCVEWITRGKFLDKPHPETGASALHVAASKGYNQVVKMLIRAGADVHAKDDEGWTPLHAAAHWAEKEACKILMENGAKLSEQNYAEQDVLRVTDKSVIDYLKELEETLEKTKPTGNLQSSQSAVLRPTTIQPISFKRTSVPRLSTDEKALLTKKDEQDENISLVLGDAEMTAVTPPPLSPSPISLQNLAKQTSSDKPPSPSPPQPAVYIPANLISNVQKSASSPTNAPWVAHLSKTGAISNVVNKNIHAFNSHPNATTSHASSLPPSGFRPPAVSCHIQPSPSYQKYSAQIKSQGSWQTPPTQPISPKESEAERKAKSRQQRAARRSTSGVTAEQLSEARAASEDYKWRSTTLQQTAIQNSAAAASASSKRSEESNEKPSTGIPMSLSTPPVTAASATPSATNKVRKSQIVRANRRGTGPVDYEALTSAKSGSSSSGMSTPAEPEQSDTPPANRFANITVRTPRAVPIPSRTYQESLQYGGGGAATAHTPVASNQRIVASGVASISSNLNGATQINGHQDYKQMYEMEKLANDKLRKQIEEMKAAENLSNGPSRTRNGIADDERKTYERRIQQLEYEIENKKHLESDYKRLKEENGALIRVISKLSTK